MERVSGFSRLADREGFTVAYPDGVGGNWNDGQPDENSAAWRQGVDDVAFLKAVVGSVGAFGKVYLVGYSNGAVMAGRAAVESDGFAGLGCVRGVWPAVTVESTS